jgi:hypothetical protein
MADFILNPRRVPRALIPCAARVALRTGGFFTAPAIDYSVRGCQLEAPGSLDPGSRLFVELVNERVSEPNHLSGRVAWSASEAPWRMGIAFDQGCRAAAIRFFERLAMAYPGAQVCGCDPERVPEDAPLAPAAPPEERALRPLEAEVLRAVGAGISAQALRSGLGERWEACLNPLFALLGRGYLVIGVPDERAAAEWAPHLA